MNIMGNEAITIVVHPAWMEVLPQKGRKLRYQAAGLDIYVSGHISPVRRPELNRLALDEALARHIPALSLRDLGCGCARRNKKVTAEQKDMFK